MPHSITRYTFTMYDMRPCPHEPLAHVQRASFASHEIVIHYHAHVLSPLRVAVTCWHRIRQHPHGITDHHPISRSHVAHHISSSHVTHTSCYVIKCHHMPLYRHTLFLPLSVTPFLLFTSKLSKWITCGNCLGYGNGDGWCCWCGCGCRGWFGDIFLIRCCGCACGCGCHFTCPIEWGTYDIHVASTCASTSSMHLFTRYDVSAGAARNRQPTTHIPPCSCPRIIPPYLCPLCLLSWWCRRRIRTRHFETDPC